MNELTAQAYGEFKDAGKYNPDTYVPPDVMVGRWADFLASEAPLYIVAGEQGRGKSALVCHWAEQALGLDRQGDSATSPPSESQTAVLLLEANRANAYGQTEDLFARWIEDTLRLDPRAPLMDYFKAALAGEGPSVRIVLVFDAVNEFETIRTGRKYSRRRLLEDCIDLADRARAIPELRGRLKVIVTLRWEAFAQMQYPLEQFEHDYEDRVDLFFRQEDSPHLHEEVPPLADPGAIFEKMRVSGRGTAPKFSWDEIPESLQQGLSNPMLLRVFMTAYDGCDIHAVKDRSIRGFENRFVNRLFIPSRHDSRQVRHEKEERAALVLDILKEMKSTASQYLRLDAAEAERRPALAKVMQRIADRSRLDQDGRARFNAYEDLVDQQIVREDVVRTPAGPGQPPVPVKRIGFTHELVTRQLLLSARKLSEKATWMAVTPIWGLVGVLLLVGMIPALGVGLLRHQWSLFVALAGFALVATCLVVTLDLGSRLVWQMQSSVTDRWRPQSDIVQAFSAFEAESQEATVAIWFGRALSIFAACGAIVTGLRYFAGRLLDVGAFQVCGVFIVTIAISYVVLGGVVELAEKLICGGRALLASEVMGWKLVGRTIDCLGAASVLVTALLMLHGGLAGVEAILRSTGDTWGAALFASLREMPVVGFPDILIWPWALVLLLAYVPFVGLPLLGWQKAHSVPGKPWPQDPERFRASYRRAVKGLAFVLFPLATILPAALYSPSLDFGNIRLTPGRQREVFFVKDGTVKILTLTPTTLGGADRAARVTTLEPLEQFKSSLRELELEGTSVSDLTPLTRLGHLRRVDLRHNPAIEDWSPLGKVGSLKAVHLQGSNVNDRIWPTLRALGALNELSLVRTSVSSAESIASLPALRQLLLEDSPVQRDLPRLGPMPHLWKLTLVGRESSQLPDLSGWSSLGRVHLRNTAIVDLRPLLTAPKLELVTLEGDQQADPEIVAALQARGVEVRRQ